MSKKILIIIGFFILVGLVGFMLYNTFFKPEPGSAPTCAPECDFGEICTSNSDCLSGYCDGNTETCQPEPSGFLPSIGDRRDNLIYTNRGWLPEDEVKPQDLVSKSEYETEIYVPPTPSRLAQGGLTQVNSVSDQTARESSLNKSGDLRYYNPDNQQFYKIDKNGQAKSLSDMKFYNVENVTWSPKQDQAIIEYPDGSQIYYDFDKNQQVTLPQNWYDFSFSDAGGQIGFLTESDNSDKRWLGVANPDGSGAKPLEPLGNNQDKVIVDLSPNNQMVAFSRTGDAAGRWRQEVLLIGYEGENFRSLMVEGRGFEPLWNNSGTQVLYSAYNNTNNYNPNLYIVGAQGDEIGRNHTNLNLNTWAHKCTFSGDNHVVYCAVPKNLPEGAGLFPEMADDIADDFYKIDLTTGMKSIIANPAESVNVENIMLSVDGKYLYFQDNFSGKIKSIQLR
ncbi:MAG: hypothetical protein PHS07_03965 [Patescibacteria group bacterium]|nr:hypothetical protein [Patescibacteria group bacterium]